MAVAFKAEHTRTAEYRFYPEDIVIKPDLNGRHDLPNIDWLIASILERGQDTPVSIRKDGDRAVLTKGYSRWRAVSHINKHGLLKIDGKPVKLQVRCVYTQETEEEGFTGTIAENRFRNETTPLDDAHNIHILMKRFQWTEERVVEFYFPTIKNKEEQKENLKWVRGRAALIQLTPEAAKALQEGRLKVPAAQKLAKLEADQQREAVKGNAKVKAKDIREASGKPKQPSLREALKEVVDSGKFSGIGGKQVEASDDMLEFLALLLNPQAGKKKEAAA